MEREEIERRFAGAGWEIDGGFSEYLLIGHDSADLSILAQEEAWTTDDGYPVFEIADHERNLTYGVREVPTPRRAAELLREHGQLPEELDRPWDRPCDPPS